MSIGKAVWYIESNLEGELRLEDVARSVGLSRFHLARAFGAATGHSMMGYARARRLTEAARRLAYGGGEILPVALSTGYGSHEAFTRAFRDQFGMTPEAVRAQGRVDNLNLTEPFTMAQMIPNTIEPKRYLDAPAMRFAGLGKRYRFSEVPLIPQLWAEFGPYFGNVPGETGDAAWGVNYDTVMDGDGFDYLAAAEVEAGAEVGSELMTYVCPPLHYAVFVHDRHVSEMNQTMQAIMAWLATSGKAHAEPGVMLERYGQGFNPETGMGDMEIWVPVKG